MKTLFFALLVFSVVATQAAVSPEVMQNLSSPDLAKRYEAEIALRGLAFQAGAPGADAPARTELIKELLAIASDPANPEPARVSALIQMPYLADGSAVPDLTALLGDPSPAIREEARCALRNNPDPAASAPLRDALAKAADSTWELGLMEALIHRADHQAAPLFVKRLESADHAVVSLAAQGLGSIGDASSLEKLRSYSENYPPTILAVAQSAVIRCADRLRANAASDSVASIWPKAANAAVRSDIFRVLLTLDEQKASALLHEILAKPDLPGASEIFRLAILSGKSSIVETVTAELPKLPSDSRLTIHAALAEGNINAHEMDLIELATVLDGDRRNIAVSSLGNAGTEKSLDFLTKESSPAASFAINRLRLDGLDQKLLASIANSAGEEQKKSILLTAFRNPSGTEDLLLKLASPDSTAESRSSALAGLSLVGAFDTAVHLLRWIGTAQPGVDVKPYQVLFRRIAPRMDSAAAIWNEGFVPVYAEASEENRRALLPMVPGISGQASAGTLVEWIKNGNGDRDDLVAQLVAWPDINNAPFLLNVAKVPDLDEPTRTKVFHAATRLLYPIVKGSGQVKSKLAGDLLEIAPEGPLLTMVETSMKEAGITPNK
jgi:HEAT repeat protein